MPIRWPIIFLKRWYPDLSTSTYALTVHCPYNHHPIPYCRWAMYATLLIQYIHIWSKRGNSTIIYQLCIISTKLIFQRFTLPLKTVASSVESWSSFPKIKTIRTNTNPLWTDTRPLITSIRTLICCGYLSKAMKPSISWPRLSSRYHTIYVYS